MKTTTQRSDHISLHPGDELTITVASPRTVKIVDAHLGEPVTVGMRKEWGELNGLRQRVRELTNRVKQQQYEIDRLATPDEEW
jgi:hypothetical protein